MNFGEIIFPSQLGRLVARLPAFPPSFLFVQALNLVLYRAIRHHDLQPLYGKQLKIHVSDVGLRLNFTVQPGGFLATRDTVSSDLMMSATACDFYLLMLHKEDPDTLFFNRRLTVEGDTELGLVVKNILGTVQFSAFDSLPQALKIRLTHVLNYVERVRG